MTTESQAMIDFAMGILSKRPSETERLAYQSMTNYVQERIREERERCAKIADRYAGSCSGLTAPRIAQDIRKEP